MAATDDPLSAQRGADPRAQRHAAERRRAASRGGNWESSLPCRTLREFAEPGTDPILNLYARIGHGRSQFLLRRPCDVVPPGPRSWTSGCRTPTVRERGVLWPRRFRHEGRDRVLRRGGGRSLPRAARILGGSISLLRWPATRKASGINGAQEVLEWLAARGEKLDAVGEPTDVAALGDMIKIGRRGSLNATVTARGHARPYRLSAPGRQRGVALLAAVLAHTDRAPSPTLEEFSTVDPQQRNSGPGARGIQHPLQATAGRAPGDTSNGCGKSWNGLAQGDTISPSRSAANPPGAPPAKSATPLTRAIARASPIKPRRGAPRAAPRTRASSIATARWPSSAWSAGACRKANESVPVADLRRLTEIYRLVLEGYFPA